MTINLEGQTKYVVFAKVVRINDWTNKAGESCKFVTMRIGVVDDPNNKDEQAQFVEIDNMGIESLLKSGPITINEMSHRDWVGNDGQERTTSTIKDASIALLM